MKSRTSTDAAPRHGSHMPGCHPQVFSMSVQVSTSARSVLGTANTTTRHWWYSLEEAQEHHAVGDASASKRHLQMLRAGRAAAVLRRKRDSSARKRPRAHGTTSAPVVARPGLVSGVARRRQRGLTGRSSGPAAARHQGPVGGTLYIFAHRALASHRCGPLTYNVRLRGLS